MEFILHFLEGGLLQWGWGSITLLIVLFCHLTLMSVTLYLHRCECHLAISMHPVLKFFFRFWLWLTTSMSTIQWVAVHRKHHAKVETDEDPHSPYVYGIKKVLFEGVELYRAEARKKKTQEEWGQGTPTDWLERYIFGGVGNIYGIRILLVLLIVLFGVKGITFWAIEMACIPFLAAGVINGACHYYGYRNFNTRDGSTNLIPWGVIICGEELHNNHHAYPGSAKFSLKWWEFDIGWMYITIFRFFGLVKINKSTPRISYDYSKLTLDMDGLKSVFKARMHVSSSYIKSVLAPTISFESDKISAEDRKVIHKWQENLMRDAFFIKEKNDIEAIEVIKRYPAINTIYTFKSNLEEIWETKFESQQKLLNAMRSWCKSAEASEIPLLKKFVKRLCAYQVQPGWK